MKRTIQCTTVWRWQTSAMHLVGTLKTLDSNEESRCEKEKTDIPRPRRSMRLALGGRALERNQRKRVASRASGPPHFEPRLVGHHMLAGQNGDDRECGCAVRGTMLPVHTSGRSWPVAW